MLCVSRLDASNIQSLSDHSSFQISHHVSFCSMRRHHFASHKSTFHGKGSVQFLFVAAVCFLPVPGGDQ